jgi:hypothetical protein
MVSKVRNFSSSTLHIHVIKSSILRDGGNFLAVGDILGNVIIIKPTPREFFFKFFDRVLEGTSRFHHILSINISPNSTYLLISRCDGAVLVFNEFKEVVSIMNVLENLEQTSRSKKVPKKASKSIPSTPIDAGSRRKTEDDDLANDAHDDNHDDTMDSPKKGRIAEQMKLFQLHTELHLRPLGAAPIHCCSISDVGM